MALEFTDFNISPDQAIREREKAFDKYINIAEPELKEKQAAERGLLASEVAQAGHKAATLGRPEVVSQVMGEAEAKAAEMLPKQGLEQLQADVTGAKMKQDIIQGRQTQALSRYLRQTEEAKDEASTVLSRKAFELGIAGRELALHQNAYIADVGMQQLYKDFEAGRENRDDIMKLQHQLALDAQKYKQELDAELERLKGELSIEVANKNIDGAKARLAHMINLAKQSAQAQAKSNALGSILSGVFGIIGGVVGTYYGGPVVGAAAAKGGEALGKYAAGQINKE